MHNLTRRRSLGAGAKAAEILTKVKGKGFGYEKTKQKRGTYRDAPTPTATACSHHADPKRCGKNGFAEGYDTRALASVMARL